MVSCLSKKCFNVKPKTVEELGLPYAFYYGC